MLCDNCGKREANVRYEENINGQRRKLNLCSECSKNMGILKFNSMDNMFSKFLNEAFIGNSEGGLIGNIGFHQYDDFFDNYLYKNFFELPSGFNIIEKNVDPIFYEKNENIKNNISTINEVTGKDKAFNDGKKDIEMLKCEMAKCIKSEDYERAAMLRDEIRNREKKGQF